ncbi:U-box domain-containing protein 33-like [Phragmites australis]|uniref:U-box domain-containing protein 33-like n=1 Tax=Phragmites australis TaxID=29695 RepID=UPI002D76D0AA|nr:U-box domain-containing protein 33-like [Phragmites australis]
MREAWAMDARGEAWENSFAGTGGEKAFVALPEEQTAGGEEEEAEKVFVALPQQHKSGKAVLAWALRHVAAAAAVVVLHVHAPAQMIPMMGTKFHVSKLRPEQVSAYRQHERENVEKHLDEYIHQCSKVKVKCEKLVIENDDVAKGITELVSLHGITKLVMGAAADKHYSRKMKMPKSKTALAVLLKADTSCKIWFVCKEHLISAREAGAPVSRKTPPPPASRSSISNLSEWGGQPNGYASNGVDGHIQRSMSEKVAPASVRTSLRLPSRLSVPTTLSRLSIEDTSRSWDSVPRGSFPSSHQASSTVTDEGFSDSSSFSMPRDDSSEILPSIHAGRDLPNQASYHDQGTLDSNIDIFDKLEEAFTEAEKYQKQAFDESLRRQKAEEELILYRQKANNFEDMSLNEATQRKEVEEALAKANKDIELMKQEMDALKQDRDVIIDKLVKMSEQRATLEQRVNEYCGTVKDLEDMLAASRSLIESQQLGYEKLKHERDNALNDVDELRKEKEKAISWPNLTWNTEFSFSELQQATQNFSDTMKVGEGGFGCVYKGFLRNTTVAIKMLRSHNLQGQSQFQQEVVVLSRVRHPNLVTLMGSCSEASGLVYEFLPNGSLEDRLACENNTPPLTWQVRTRIIAEICSALVFLHSSNPHPVIHGDLKPANILLDANLVSKLSDFGISCLLSKSSTMSTSLYRTTNPRGTFAYMDPEFLTTGELTARSDIYSLGIVILQLVTGKPALGIGRAVEDALEKDELELLIDQSAGEWPFVQAKKLMLLGLQCAELSRRRRPYRMSDVWCVIEPLVKSASLSTAPQSFAHRFVESHTPSYFLCPISQEVMRNPHIAADGFTYEAEVIRGWLHSGRSTSPMTKLPLAHHHLIPNHALHSAIQEYFQQQQQQKSPS